jgi:hypothetical protein
VVYPWRLLLTVLLLVLQWSAATVLVVLLHCSRVAVKSRYARYCCCCP